MKGCGSDEFIRIEKPKKKHKYKEYDESKRVASTHLLEYPSEEAAHREIVDQAYNNGAGIKISPMFFSDVQASEFFNSKDVLNQERDGDLETTEDQQSSIIDYSENPIKNRQDRTRDMLFKYDNQDPIPVDKKTQNNIKFHQKRRNTLSRDRVPTRNGASRARRKRFNAFTKNSKNVGYNEFGDKISVYNDYTNNISNGIHIQENGLDL